MAIRMRMQRRRIVFSVAFVLVAITVAVLWRAYTTDEGGPLLRMVSGTEYISGETGQGIVRLSDFKGSPLEGAVCNATILYPDKSYFMLDLELQPSTVPGNYFRQFTTPTVNGIYEETIMCRSGQGDATTVSSSFHVSVALNFIVELSRLQAERYADLVRRMNETQLNINGSREQIIKEINETVLLDIIGRIDEAQAGIQSNITGSIAASASQATGALNQSIDQRFVSLYSRMAGLGSSLVNLFGS